MTDSFFREQLFFTFTEAAADALQLLTINPNNHGKESGRKEDSQKRTAKNSEGKERRKKGKKEYPEKRLIRNHRLRWFFDIEQLFYDSVIK
ncbi:MAG TPA: hypothetical protein VF581_10790 [Flavobacterium sp.]